MMRGIIIWAIITLLFPLAVSTWAKPNSLSLNVTDVTWSASGAGGYSPFNEFQLFQQEWVRVDYDNDLETPVNIVVTFSKGNGPDYNRYAKKGSDKLYYNLYASDENNPGTDIRRVLKEYPDITRRFEVLRDRIRRNTPSPLLLTYYITIPPGQIVEPGIYRDTVTVTLYTGTWDDIDDEIDSVKLKITIVVPEVADLTFNESSFLNNHVEILFPEAKEGDEHPFSVRVRSNSSYSVTVVSENDGKLLEEGVAPSPDQPEILYTLITDTAEIRPRLFPRALFSYSGMTDTYGASFPVKARLGPVLVPEGEYTDVLIFTVTDH